MERTKKNILIIKPSSFGDIVQANPTLVALREAFPGCTCSWLVFDRWADIVSLFPDVDRTITWRRDGGIAEFARLVKLLRAGRFDLVVDLQGLTRSALLARLSGAHSRIGVPGMKELSWLLIKEPFPESRGLNAVYRSLESVRFLTGRNHPARFRLAVPAAASAEVDALLRARGIAPGDPLVGVIPAVRGRAKQWPPERFRELIARLLAAKPALSVVLLGARGDSDLAGKRIVNLCGKTTIPQLAAALQRCSAVAGGDTGPVHLAAALDIPVTVIFGGSDASETSPVTPGTTVLRRDMPCSPCRGHLKCTDTPCLTGISVDEVFASLATKLHI